MREIIYPPICLSGSVAAPPATGLIVPDPALKNPFHEDMWIDEMRFTIQGQGATLPGPGAIAVKMELGRQPLTGGANVPIWVLGKALANVQDNSNAPDGATTVDPTFVWRFTKPLFVPSGERIVPTVFSSKSATGKTVFVQAFGRSIPPGTPKPQYVEIPFAAAWQGAVNIGTNTTDQSYERDLMNPFNTDMFVECFNGRAATSGGSGSLWDSNSTAAASGGQTDTTTVTVRAVSSMAGMMIRDEVPFDHVFYGPERSWKVNTWIPPKAFFKFFLNEQISAKGNAGWTPHIAMVGYRRVELNDVFA